MNLATFWVQATSGVNYVRAEMPAKWLPAQCLELNPSDIQTPNPFLLDIDTHAYSFPRQQGAAIWLFSGNTTRALMMKAMQEKGIPVFFEADDNYTRHPDVAETSRWKIKREPGRDTHSYETASDIAAFCDGVIVSTPLLADVYGEINDNVHVARNCVDPDDWDPLDKPDDGILRIGWAASDSHRKDAPLLKQAFRWLYGRPDVEIVIMGVHNAHFPVPITRLPWCDSLSDYRKMLQAFDVMLCPLQRTDWADCKSDLKALEAGMAGAMSVVSDSPAYDLWADKTFVCKTEQDWEKSVKTLYKNRELVREMQVEHRKYVISERTIEKGIGQWRKALRSCSSKTTPAEASTLAASGAATSP